MQSLASLALSRLPVADYASLVEEGYLVPEEFGSWETWRERAIKDFGISAEYFDLPLHDYPRIGKRNITPQYRYLEIQTKFYLSPESAASVSSDGEINGIYESLTGVYESLRRNDAEMVLFFAQRLKPNPLNILKKSIRSGEILHQVPNYRPGGYDIFYFRTLALRKLADYLFSKTALTTLKKAGLYPEKWQMAVEEAASVTSSFSPHKLGNKQQQKLGILYLISLGRRDVFDYAKQHLLRYGPETILVENTVAVISSDELLYAALASGRIDFFEEVKKRIAFSLNNAVKVEDKYPSLPLFLNSYTLKGGRTNIPQLIFNCVAYSGNARIFLYLRDYAINPPELNEQILFSGYYVHNRPEDFFSLCTLGGSYFTGFVHTDIDIDYYALGTYTSIDAGRIAYEIVAKNLGQVEVVSSFYPFVNGAISKDLLQIYATKGYPLSLLIIQNINSLPPLVG
ncbi:Hypothetical protein BRZCDTV_109 [Brazilian cedratvirus IHUMI]|uniref:Uncharacterized protein n=1 Tax=Brazilian cedratvirus IHUMI TaxID=2126980 RepID=A0A2R8FDD3_9VIRU|nr:Hypothetical protein BRZCDTV_109 [Brazilian cedratvirus IHUMI]